MLGTGKEGAKLKLGEKLQTLRKARGLSQEQLAEQLGVSRQSVSKWEAEQSYPELDKVIGLSRFFAVSTDYLLKDEWEGEAEKDREGRDEQKNQKNRENWTGEKDREDREDQKDEKDHKDRQDREGREDQKGCDDARGYGPASSWAWPWPRSVRFSLISAGRSGRDRTPSALG